MRVALTEDWRKPYIEQRQGLYFSPHITGVIKSRRMRQAGHMTRMGDRRCAYWVVWENMSERGRLEDLNVDDRIKSKWILSK